MGLKVEHGQGLIFERADDAAVTGLLEARSDTRHQRGLSHHRRGRGQLVLVRAVRNRLCASRSPPTGTRHRDDQPQTGRSTVPRSAPIVVIMPPHTKRPLIFIQNDAAASIPSAAQHARRSVLPNIGED